MGWAQGSVREHTVGLEEPGWEKHSSPDGRGFFPPVLPPHPLFHFHLPQFLSILLSNIAIILNTYGNTLKTQKDIWDFGFYKWGENVFPQWFKNYLSGIWKRIDTCICMAVSLCCIPETNTALLINYMHVCVLSCSVVSNSSSPWTAAHQAPLSMGSSRHEYWSGLLCLPPGDLHKINMFWKLTKQQNQTKVNSF